MTIPPITPPMHLQVKAQMMIPVTPETLPVKVLNHYIINPLKRKPKVNIGLTRDIIFNRRSTRPSGVRGKKQREVMYT